MTVHSKPAHGHEHVTALDLPRVVANATDLDLRVADDMRIGEILYQC